MKTTVHIAPRRKMCVGLGFIGKITRFIIAYAALNGKRMPVKFSKTIDCEFYALVDNTQLVLCYLN